MVKTKLAGMVEALKEVLTDSFAVETLERPMGGDFTVRVKMAKDFSYIDLRSGELSPSDVYESVLSEFKNIRFYEAYRAECEAEVAELNDKVSGLEAEIERLKRYETFYELYKNLNDSK